MPQTQLERELIEALARMENTLGARLNRLEQRQIQLALQHKELAKETENVHQLASVLERLLSALEKL
ncbi:MAG: hypothetical protein AB7E47_12625 [Desulfovibrionaceae bacterium]